LVALGVVVVAAAAVTGVRLGWNAWHGEPGAPQGAEVAGVPALLAAVSASRATAVAHAPATAAAHLQTALHLAGQAVPLEGDRVALASGARFDLRITPPAAGRLEVFAVAPSGQVPVMLWSARAHGAGQALRTPTLRLEGDRGVEKLRLLLRGPAGEVLAMHEIRIWHL
jgi:hypothetical protein